MALDFLVSRQLAPVVIVETCKLIARLTKLFWLDVDADGKFFMQDIYEHASKLMVGWLICHASCD